MSFERVLRWALVAIAVTGLTAGIVAYLSERSDLADLCWMFATVPVVAGLAISIVKDLLSGRFGVAVEPRVTPSQSIEELQRRG